MNCSDQHAMGQTRDINILMWHMFIMMRVPFQSAKVVSVTALLPDLLCVAVYTLLRLVSQDSQRHAVARLPRHRGTNLKDKG